MRLTRAFPAVCAALLLLTVPGVVRAAEGELLSIGEEAPNFQTVDIKGQPFNLEEEINGGPIFLVFWSIF